MMQKGKSSGDSALHPRSRTRSFLRRDGIIRKSKKRSGSLRHVVSTKNPSFASSCASSASVSPDLSSSSPTHLTPEEREEFKKRARELYLKELEEEKDCAVMYSSGKLTAAEKEAFKERARHAYLKEMEEEGGKPVHRSASVEFDVTTPDTISLSSTAHRPLRPSSTSMVSPSCPETIAGAWAQKYLFANDLQGDPKARRSSKGDRGERKYRNSVIFDDDATLFDTNGGSTIRKTSISLTSSLSSSGSAVHSNAGGSGGAFKQLLSSRSDVFDGDAQSSSRSVTSSRSVSSPRSISKNSRTTSGTIIHVNSPIRNRRLIIKSSKGVAIPQISKESRLFTLSLDDIIGGSSEDESSSNLSARSCESWVDPTWVHEELDDDGTSSVDGR